MNIIKFKLGSRDVIVVAVVAFEAEASRILRLPLVLSYQLICS